MLLAPYETVRRGQFGDVDGLDLSVIGDHMKRSLALVSVAAGLLGVGTLGATAAPRSPVAPVTATEHSQVEKVHERRYYRRHYRRHYHGPVVYYGAPYRPYGYYDYGYRPYGYASIGLPFIHLDIGGHRHYRHRHHRHW